MSKMVHTTLLIDDSDIDLFIQRRFLEVYRFSNQLISFKSASEALKWLRNLNGSAAPEIIFLDLNMPEIDGFEFLKSFEELPQSILKKTKIVVLTSSNSLKDREQAFESPNVIQFITKPLKQSDIEELQSRVNGNGKE
jgi:two-component system, NarL family, nitrate/nitrite response regulator NarL